MLRAAPCSSVLLSEGPVRSQDVQMGSGGEHFKLLLSGFKSSNANVVSLRLLCTWFQGEKRPEDHLSVTKRQGCQAWWSYQNDLCLQETTVRPLKAPKNLIIER